MVKTMAGDLMPFLGDAPDQAGKPLGHPAENEKSSLDGVICKTTEDPVRVPLNPWLKTIPAASRGDILESRDLEVVFHIDTQEIA